MSNLRSLTIRNGICLLIERYIMFNFHAQLIFLDKSTFKLTESNSVFLTKEQKPFASELPIFSIDYY